MPADVYVQDGVVYPDEATAVVAMHPNIPEELKRIFITKPDEKPNTKDENVYEPPATLDQNILTPRGLEGNQQFQQDPKLETPIQYIYPEPYGLNPPERGPGLESPPRSPAKVLFKTASPLVNITDQDIDNAIQITTSFGAGTMAGVKAAKSLNKINDLGQATILEHQNVHPDKILHDTGWYRDVDNRWKFELDDTKARLNEDWWDKPAVDNRPAGPKYTYDDLLAGKITKDEYLKDEKDFQDRLFTQTPFDRNEGKVRAKLPEVIEHPELYKAYPALKDVTVVRDPNVQTAHWDAANNEIVIGQEGFNNMSTFLHEIQHAIQHQEGFAAGAAWGEAGKSYTLKHAAEAYKQIFVPLNELYQKILSKRGTVPTQAELNEINRLQAMAKKYGEYKAAGDELAMEKYMNTAGEVEARNVEARMMLNAAERRSMHPNYSVPEEYQNPTINFQAGIQTPYGFKPYGGAEAPPKAANDLDAFGKQVSGNYEDALRDQIIKKYVNKDTKVGDTEYWRKIAAEEGHIVFNKPNGVAAARAHSENGKTTLLIQSDGRRIVFHDGAKIVREKMK